MWRVLIVEDDPLMRDYFAASVSRSDRLCLVDSVGSRAEAMASLDAQDDPLDVLLTDLGLPDGSGLEVIRYARRRHPGCEALVISMFGDEDNVLASIEAGALGYIHKDSAPEDVAQTILDMKAGASPISPMIARRVLAKYRALQMALSAPPLWPGAGGEDPQSQLPENERVQLSNREQEVLELIARGFTYAEIARLKTVSVHTVQTHIKNLYGKLAVHSKSEAVYEATRIGLLRRP